MGAQQFTCSLKCQLCNMCNDVTLRSFCLTTLGLAPCITRCPMAAFQCICARCAASAWIHPEL